MSPPRPTRAPSSFGAARTTEHHRQRADRPERLVHRAGDGDREPAPDWRSGSVTVNGQTATAPITLTADGAYEVVATTTPGGPSTSATVRVDAGAPRIEASRVPETTPSPEPVTVSLLGIDGGIGIDTITFSAAGALRDRR